MTIKMYPRYHVEYLEGDHWVIRSERVVYGEYYPDELHLACRLARHDARRGEQTRVVEADLDQPGRERVVATY